MFSLIPLDPLPKKDYHFIVKKVKSGHILIEP